MTESEETVAATPATVKPPSKAKKAATPKAKSGSKKAASTHPATAQMVNAAIKNLKERGGSSLQAIKKYISSAYKVDAEKVAPFIKKYLISAVDNGTLIRTKGKGASGSFKLAVAKAETTKKKPAVKKAKAAAPSEKPPKPKKAKVKVVKKSKSPVKPKATKATPAISKKTPPTPSKTKITTKAPAAKKPKSPKPKKAVKKAVMKKAVTKK